MSMTLEEAVERLKRLKRSCRDLAVSMPEEPGWALHGMALDMAISALRPVSREQVEKVWRGEWVHTHSSDNFWTEVWKCSHCDFEDNYGECFDFCPFCGAAQTDEAVKMVMERLRVLTNDN